MDITGHISKQSLDKSRKNYGEKSLFKARETEELDIRLTEAPPKSCSHSKILYVNIHPTSRSLFMIIRTQMTEKFVQIFITYKYAGSYNIQKLA